MTKVLLTGFLGGAFCGFLILIPAFYFAPAAGVVKNAAWHFTQIEYALTAGVTFGGAFGVIAFPVCYYLFLKNVSLKLSLAVTIPATVVAGWLGLLLPQNVALYAIPVEWLARINAPVLPAY